MLELRAEAKSEGIT